MLKRETKLILFFPIILALTVTLYGSLTQGFSGVDILFHLNIAQHYSVGDINGAVNVAFNENHTFYPPLFHLLLALGFWFGNAEAWALLLQVVFLPLTVGCFMFLVYRIQSLSASFYGGLMLLGSMAFLDRVIQAQPQAVDFMLWSISFYCFMAVKEKSFLISSILMVWNHGLVSASFLGSLLLGWFRRRNWKLLSAWMIGISFVVGVSLFFLASGLGNYGGRVDTDQEYLFWNNSTFVFEYLGLISVGFLVYFYQLFNFIKGKPVSKVAKLCMVSVACLAVMIPVWPDRWLQYSSLPLALLILNKARDLSYRGSLIFKGAVWLMLVYTLGGLFVF